MRQRDAGGAAVQRVAGDREGAQRSAVEAVREADDLAAASDLSGELERRLDGVRSSRPGKLYAILEAARAQDELIERGQEIPLGRGEHIQRVHDAVTGQILDQGLPQHGVVVPVVERAGTGEEVEVGPARLVI